jgi:hypothetical protein
MSNARLTKAQRDAVTLLFEEVQARLKELAADKSDHLFALRRRLYTQLVYAERGTPAARKRLKTKKWKFQSGLCAICNKPMDEKYSELDRTRASAGYTEDNTRLVHHQCHIDDQAKKKFNDEPLADIS